MIADEMNAWSHLPNAAVIDEVLKSLKEQPKAWGAARDAARGTAWDAARGAAWDAARGAARGAAWDTARGAARGAARDAAWNAARSAVWGAVWGAARGAARDAAWSAARDAVAALITYDDAGKLIKQPVAHLQGLYRLDPHPMFLLLQPASAVFNQLEFKT